MATTSVRLISGSQLTGSAATYYTSPSGTKTVIKSCTVTNTTAGAVALTLYLIPSGDSASAANTVISGKSLAAGEAYTCPEVVNQVLEAGGLLQAKGLDLSINASGVQIV